MGDRIWHALLLTRHTLSNSIPPPLSLPTYQRGLLELLTHVVHLWMLAVPGALVGKLAIVVGGGREFDRVWLVCHSARQILSPSLLTCDASLTSAVPVLQRALSHQRTSSSSAQHRQEWTRRISSQAGSHFFKKQIFIQNTQKTFPSETSTNRTIFQSRCLFC